MGHAALVLGILAAVTWLASANTTTRCSAQVDVQRCPTGVHCSELTPDCLDCECPSECRYGEEATAECAVPAELQCLGDRHQRRAFVCQYCYLVDGQEHECESNFDCHSYGDPNQVLYRANCTVHRERLCLGRRLFLKQVKCNWTGGYKWTSALILSVTLGGFGADRFYLGHWQEGVGKLFSFGGLGVWTLVDVVLIGIRYLGPADGSLYI